MRRALVLALPCLPLGLLALAALQGEAPAPLDGLYSRAEVVGPRGSFVTEIVSLGGGQARFLQVHPDGRTEILVVDQEAYRPDASGSWGRAEAGSAALVRGHDVPRLVADRGGRPARLELARPPELGGGSVGIELDDWRHVIDRALPFAVTFIDPDGGERYAYRYTHVLPFRLAPGIALPREPRALHERLGDLGALVRAHEEVLAAHRASDAEALVAGSAPTTTVSGRGRLSSTTRPEFLERMRGALGAVRFTRYADTAVPVVAVSADGTLGWLACEIEAEGTRTVDGASEPLAYAFSWVELSARAADPVTGQGAGAWQAIGNASSERP